MFNDRRRLRRWAAPVLLMWLFGLAISVANACALGVAVHDLGQTQAENDAHEHAKHDNDSERTNCADFCEKSSIGAPVVKLDDEGMAALGLAMPVSGHVLLIPQPAPMLLPAVATLPLLRGSPPLRIALQRLAL